MKKIDFVNGTTIDGAKTFNDIQQNVEEVFNGEEAMGSIVVEDITSSNLFNPNDIFAGKWLDDNGQPMTGNDKDILTNFIKVKPNTKYTISGFSSTEQYLIVGSYNSSKTFNSMLVPSQASSTQTISFTTNATDEYIRCAFSDVNMGSETLQIEKGDATPYKPHEEYGYSSKKSMGKIVVDDITCKNILINKLYSTTSSGITYTNNGDGSSTLNGTASASYRSTNSIIPLTNKEVLKAGTYTFSCENIKDTNIKIYISLYNMSDVTWATDVAQLNGTTPSKTFTITKDYYVHIYFLVEAGKSVSNVKAYVQLEKGDKATPYTPHKEFSTTKRNLYNDSLLNSNYCGGSTNLKEMYLYNNGLVVINFSVTLNNTITANTSTQLVTIPSELLPSKNVSLMTVNINKEGKEIAYINSGEGKIRWRSSVNAVAGDEIYIQGTYVKDEGLSTSTQSASTMSLRPDTTEMEETE